ncbi:unnamed protein product [Candida parapsilosis]
MDLNRHVENNVINNLSHPSKHEQIRQSYKDLDRNALRQNQIDMRGDTVGGGSGDSNSRAADQLVGSVPANWTWSSF